MQQGWDESRHHVSRAFDEWKLVDQDVRAFLQLALKWSHEGYERLWREAEEEVSRNSDPDTWDEYDLPDTFGRMALDLWPSDYDWMIRAAAVKDAVTAFEVYLEKSLDEALVRRSPGVKRQRGYPSPAWRTLVEGHKLLGTTVDTDRVKEIRGLRHSLTHQRGELRTVADRERLVVDDDEEIIFRGSGTQRTLSPTVVQAVFDDLAVVVRTADAAVWSVAWGGATTASLEEIRKRLNVDDN